MQRRLISNTKLPGHEILIPSNTGHDLLLSITVPKTTNEIITGWETAHFSVQQAF
ncbi:MAG: hypothetical protein ACYS1A_05425 [Planctomycetota bacterium]